MLLGDSAGTKYRPFVVFKANPSKIPETEEENKRLRYGFGKTIWRDVSVGTGSDSSKSTAT
jgi:hypothetical protein